MTPDRPVTRMDWARLRAEEKRNEWAQRQTQTQTNYDRPVDATIQRSKET